MYLNTGDEEMNGLRRAIGFLALLCMLLFCGSAAADDHWIQDGLQVQMTGDGVKYGTQDAIGVTVELGNLNTFGIGNVIIELGVPQGYAVAGDGSAAMTESLLSSDETLKHQVVLVPKDEGLLQEDGQLSGLPQTGDRSDLTMWTLLLLAAGGALTLLMHKRLRCRVLSIMLCAALLGGMLPPVSTLAQTNHRTMELERVVVVDGEPVRIPVVISYDYAAPADEKVVSREEWLTALAEFADIEEQTDGEYSFDDDADAQNPGLIEAYVRRGQADLHADGQLQKFYPQADATREFIARTAAAVTLLYTTQEESSGLSDYDQLTYAEECAAAVKAGVLSAIDGAFCPDRGMTQSELNQAKAALSLLCLKEKNEETTFEVVYADGVVESTLPYTLDQENQKIFVEPQHAAHWQAGDVCALYDQDGDDADIAIRIKRIYDENGWSVVEYETPELGEVIISMEASGTAPLHNGVFIPAEGVEIEQAERTRRSFARGIYNDTVPLPGIKRVKTKIGDVPITVDVDFKSIDYNAVIVPTGEKDKVELKAGHVVIDIGSEFEFELDVINADADVMLGFFTVPMPGGLIGAGKVYLHADAQTGLNISVSCDEAIGLNYYLRDGEDIRQVIHNSDTDVKRLKAQGKVETGLKLEAALHWMCMELLSFGGVGGAGIHAQKVADGYGCIDATVYGFLKFYSEGFNGRLITRTREIYNHENSPVKETRHYEDGKRVPACTMHNVKDTVIRYTVYYKGAMTQQPIPNALITAVADGQELTSNQKTGDDGRVHILLLGLRDSVSCDVTVKKEGFKPLTHTHTIEPGENNYVSLYLEPLDTAITKLQGFVKDETGTRPLEGAKVTLYKMGVQGQEVCNETLTDSDGMFEFVVEKNQMYCYQIEKEGYRTTGLLGFAAELSGVTYQYTILLGEDK